MLINGFTKPFYQLAFKDEKAYIKIVSIEKNS